MVLVRASLAQAFARTRDRVLLGVAAALALAWVANGGGLPLLPAGYGAGVLAAAVAAGGGLHGRLLARLDALVTHTPLAADALGRGPAGGYLAAVHGAAMLCLAAALHASGSPAGWAMVAYAGGVAIATGVATLRQDGRAAAAPARAARATDAPPATRWRALLMTVVRQQTWPGGTRLQIAALFLLAAALPTAAALLVPLVRAHEDLRVAAFAAPAGIALVRAAQVDDALVRFASFAGFGLGRTWAAHVPAPLLFFALAAAFACVTGYELPAVAAGLGVLAMLILTARVMLHRLYDRRRAAVILSLSAVAASVLGGTAPAVLAAALPAWLLWFGLRARRTTWDMP